jgi:hypothetical protein
MVKEIPAGVLAQIEKVANVLADVDSKGSNPDYSYRWMAALPEPM